MMEWMNPCSGMIMMVVWWVLFIAGIAALVYWISKSSRSKDTSSGDNSALKILRDRYAAGEINKEEFEQRKKTLQNN